MQLLSSRINSLPFHFPPPLPLPHQSLFTKTNPIKFPTPASSSAAAKKKRMLSTANLSHSPISPSKSKEEDHQQQQQQQQQQENLNQVLKYHNQTKHSFNRYARGPHGLDWANQPNPFRRYLPAPLLPLQHLPPQPHHQDQTQPLYPSIFQSQPSIPPQPLSFSSLSQFLYDSLSLSAWKTTGFSTWSLRVNPSSGNLHPTEAYVISPSIPPLSSSPFVAHYAPKSHALELRTQFSSSSFFRLFPANSFLVGISSIFWREAWKYGERAFRYCNHDVGHAIAALAFAAAPLGWDIKLLDGLGFSDLERVMGLDSYPQFKIPSRAVKGQFPDMEFEHPDCVLLVFPNNSAKFSIDYKALSADISQFSSFEWKGSPNSLSKDHVCWDIIYRTAEIVKKPLTLEIGLSIDPFGSSGSLFSGTLYKDLTVREVVRKRRSAVDMDGVHVMERTTFYQILLHCLPSGFGGEKQGKQLAVPFRVLSWDAELHAVLFVHRVKDLPKGLYFLVRKEGHFDRLKRAMRSEFEWEKPDGCPAGLPLYRLATVDCQQLAQRLSCHQEIASHGCFSLGMVAHFEPTLREKNVWMYPRLFWESGVLGQVLYLEAHAVGISSTGIGCYFDDAVHDVLGISDSEFQSLYHFTVGSPVLDNRIMSLPAYPGPDIDA
ncbi:hypothetical protein MRB53_019863 [Persea americana]|uniref:Uncharacterized protein n=1 Tax=Persea americana TaxID=3435 RepID=A0ACC2L086_PERAE|nr:hypothetical protein MRB53_019863 [Persea americana]